MSEPSELQKEINKAFIAISTVPVSGDSVDRMAMAREHLHRAYMLAAPEPKEAEPDG